MLYFYLVKQIFSFGVKKNEKKSFRCSICGSEIKDFEQSWVISMQNTDEFLNPHVICGSHTYSYLFCRSCYNSFLHKLKNFLNEVQNG